MGNVVKRLRKLDMCLLKFINLKLSSKVLDKIMVPVTHLGSFLFSLCLFVALMVIPKCQGLGKQLFFALTISNITVVLIKFLTKRPRPFLRHDFLNVKIIGVLFEDDAHGTECE